MSNLVTNGSSELALIEKLLDYIQQALEKSRMDKKAKMIAALRSYMKAHGTGSLMYKMVDEKFAKDFEEAMERADIPYMTTWDTRGHAVFIVRECDSEKFCDLQNEIFKLHPDFYAQCQVSELCDSALKKNEKTLIEVSVDTKADFEELQQRLYASGQGVVAAPGIIPADGRPSVSGYKMYIDPDSIYKKNGEDLCKVELQWAFESTSNDYLDYRLSQAAYDSNEIEIMMAEIKKGHSVSVVDELNTSSVYTEITPKGATFYTLGQSGVWMKDREIPLPDFDDPVSVNAFKSAMKTALEKTNNQRVIPITQTQEYLQKRHDIAFEEIYGKKEKTKKGEEVRNKEYKQNPYGLDNSPILEEGQNEEIKVENTFGIGYGKPDITFEVEDELNPNRNHRPYFESMEHSNDDSHEFYWYKTKGKNMIDAVNRLAHIEAEATAGFSDKTPAEKTAIVKQKTLEILKANQPGGHITVQEIAEYFSEKGPKGVDQDGNEYLISHDRYNRLIENYEHENTKDDNREIHDLHISERKISVIKREENEKAQKQIAQEKSAQKDREEKEKPETENEWERTRQNG